MKNVRLNDRVREAILRRILEHAFGKAREAIAADRESLARLVYDDVYPSDIQRKMLRLPEGFFETGTQICVSMGGQCVQFDIPDRLVAWKHHYFNRPAATYPADHPFTKLHNELHARTLRLDEESSRARAQAMAVLQSCETCKQLVAAWPEAEPFSRDFATSAAPRVLALTVKVSDLNGWLGLGEKKS
jgi:hypothetical protein